MVIEVPSPSIGRDVDTVGKTRIASANAPDPVTTIASVLARELYDEYLAGLRAPADHKVVPLVTVSVAYRFEPTKEKK